MAIVVEAHGVSLGGDFSFTCPAGTNFLVCFYIIGRVSTSDLTSLDYNGDAMTEYGNAIYVGSGLVQVWTLVNPDTGSAYTINSPINDATRDRDALVAVALSGVDTTDPIRDSELIYADGDASDIITNSALTSAVGDLVLEGVSNWRDRTPTVTEGQTELQTGTNYGSAYSAGAASVTVGWDLNYGSGTDAAWAILSIKPASAPAATTLPSTNILFL